MQETWQIGDVEFVAGLDLQPGAFVATLDEPLRWSAHVPFHHAKGIAVGQSVTVTRKSPDGAEVVWFAGQVASVDVVVGGVVVVAQGAEFEDIPLDPQCNHGVAR